MANIQNSPSVVPKTPDDFPNKDLVDKFVTRILNYNQDDTDKISAAAVYSAKKHGDQKRKSGEPCLIHPIAVAEILMSYTMDADTVCAGLLHDTLEDTDTTEEDLAKLFGKEVAEMVQAVTKISKITEDKSIQEAETIKKMFFAMSKDLRVILIKLADKLHNMRTLSGLKPERRIAFANDCLDIFVPIADSLGMQNMKSELEDLTLKALKPDSYEYISTYLLERKGEYNAFIKQVSKAIEEECKKLGFKDIDVSGRVKHAYSIYMKIKKRKKDIDEIYDILGIRVICNTTVECYTILGVIHSMWVPIEGRFKDYIAMPKANNYQSLHTTVLGPQSRHLEIQIRTKEMHKTAEEGVAAHWAYKASSGSESGAWKSLDSINYQKIVKKIKNWAKEIEQSEDYMEEIKNELLKDSIVVFTPQGHVIELPVGSTALDFAYKVHTEVGNHCSGARADGSIIPLNKPLANTQIVEIMTSPSAHPNMQWMEYAQASSTRKKIKAWLNKYQLDNVPEVKEKKPQPQPQKKPEPVSSASTRLIGGTINYVSQEPTGSLVVGEESNVMYSFAKCCNPMQGDDVLAYITRGRGYIIHKRGCSNLKHMAEIDQRTVNVKWTGEEQMKRYRIVTKIDNDIFGEIDNAVKGHGGRLRKGSLDVFGNRLTGDFTIIADNEESIKKCTAAIRLLPSVLELSGLGIGDPNYKVPPQKPKATKGKKK
ncbi:MAG: bifunctional (p)ppGpp synthetase/guanosine-3',5'-bis(diphosphate) 3'-pyrophosphohydrolase [Spirochaetales bacterium]|nr:bifunctional (p)ppGpp synthetase/guanosine-3',5'-bis(diphosphate) 3'-pyrophosphohydrolase [Candidatus Physcosoma equi]